MRLEELIVELCDLIFDYCSMIMIAYHFLLSSSGQRGNQGCSQLDKPSYLVPLWSNGIYAKKHRDVKFAFKKLSFFCF